MPAVIEPTTELVVLVRELHADEEYVMMAFERHASHCTRCADPLLAHEQGQTLCDRGHQYAIDVAEYLYSKNGKAHSVVDRELNQATLVKIPRSCVAVRGLLLAVENGLRLRRRGKEQQRPLVTYDETYSVPSQQLVQQPVVYHEIIEREPRTPKRRRRVIVYPSPRGSPSRGSLYSSDAADRVERYNGSSRVYRPSEYFR